MMKMSFVDYLAHVGRHCANAVLHEVETQDEQLAGNVAKVGRRRREVFTCHALQYAHERRDEPVDVAQIVHTRRLQDHQRAKQLRGRTGCHSATTQTHNLSLITTHCN